MQIPRNTCFFDGTQYSVQHIAFSWGTKGVQRGQVNNVLSKNNLFIVLDENENKQITTDGKYGITNGMSVSRNEFGIKGGIFWSPKSNFLAFYHENLSHVSDYPLLDITTTPAQIENIKYPMAGELSPVVSIGIYNLLNKEVIWLKIAGPKDQYLTNVTWGPNEKYLYEI